MKGKRDYYAILGIDRTADETTIKKAYRKLAKKCHPDMNKDDPNAEQRFKELTEAYAVLSDPKKRKMYDQYGTAEFEEGENPFWRATSGSSGRQYGGYRTYQYNQENMDDIFGDIFGDIFNERNGFRGGKKRGKDVYADIAISFEEAVFGCEKRIMVQDPGATYGKEQVLQVRIPAGIDSGKSVRLKGKGKPGSNGGNAGDLLLRVHVKEKPGYERRGLDVYAGVQIPYTTAVLGGEAVVPTLYGNVICKISKGTQSGTKIRLKNKGIVDMNNPTVRGDHYAVVQIQVPRNLTPQAEQKLKEYAQECGRTVSGKNVA